MNCTQTSWTKWTLVFAVGLCLLTFAGMSWAAGSASTPPPPAPAIDVSGLPDSARVRPINPDKKPHQVQAALIADRTQLQAGQRVRLGLHLTQDPGWHTYWKANTEVGQPTDIEWGLPPGATASPYAYPIPQRFEASGIVSFGYDKEVLLFTEFEVPADLPAGPTTLTATANWLACEVMCIPAKDVKLSLPIEVVAADAPPVPPGPYSALFDHYTKQHPTPSQTTGTSDDLSTHVSRVNGIKFEGSLSHSALNFGKTHPFKVVLKVTPESGGALTANKTENPWPTFTPIVSTAEYYLEITQFNPTDDGGLVVLMEGEAFELDPETLKTAQRPTDMVVGGLFQLQQGGADGEWLRTEFTIPLPWVALDAPVTASTSPLWALVDASSDAEPDNADCPPCESGSANSGDELVYEQERLGTALMDDAVCASMTGAVDGPSSQGGNLIFMLLAAIAGGLLLNIMPCVLPVLTLKLYSLIEQADITNAERQKAGLAYTAGIVFSFLVLALIVVIIQLFMGGEIGWGFQFQYPAYTAALAGIVFVFGLSLFGVFEIPAFGSNTAAGAGSKEGVVGYFFTGVFATLLATPCSAPFLGTAMGFAFSQPKWVIFIFFGLAGLGLALPFLLIAFIPPLFKVMPRPGAWMETFKQFMGFTLIATTVWLVDVLAAQVSLESTLGFVGFLAFLGFSAWVFGHWGGLGASAQKQVVSLLAAICISVLGGYWLLDFKPLEQIGKDVTDGTIHWKLFRNDRMASVLNRYREGDDLYFDGKPLFIDFTAEWCLTCKANEKTVIETETVAQALAEHDAVPLKADWTNYNEEITRWLGCFGRAGVPYYVVLPSDPSQKAIPLGETVTQGSIVDALALAAGSTTP